MKGKNAKLDFDVDNSVETDGFFKKEPTTKGKPGLKSTDGYKYTREERKNKDGIHYQFRCSAQRTK